MQGFMLGPMELLIVLTLAVGAIFWAFVLIDCLRNEPSEGNDKLVWALVIVLTTVLGAVLYLIVRRPKRIQQCGK